MHRWPNNDKESIHHCSYESFIMNIIIELKRHFLCKRVSSRLWKRMRAENRISPVYKINGLRQFTGERKWMTCFFLFLFYVQYLTETTNSDNSFENNKFQYLIQSDEFRYSLWKWIPIFSLGKNTDIRFYKLNFDTLSLKSGNPSIWFN